MSKTIILFKLEGHINFNFQSSGGSIRIDLNIMLRNNFENVNKWKFPSVHKYIFSHTKTRQNFIIVTIIFFKNSPLKSIQRQPGTSPWK